VYTTSADGTLILWDPKTAGSLIKKGTDDGRFHQAGLTCSAVNKESQLALTGAEDGTLRLTHLETGKILSIFSDHKESIEGLAFSDDSRFPFAVSGSVDGSICVWDMNTFQLRTSMSHDVSSMLNVEPKSQSQYF
jgi:WD40 repeat protein